MINEISRKIFPKYFSKIPHEKLLRYRQALQIVYGMSAVSLLYIVYTTYEEKKELITLSEYDPVYGRPVVKDRNDVYRRLRESGIEKTSFDLYTKENGWVKTEYNREQYLKELEQETLDRIREAQTEWLKKHKELPPNALDLVSSK